MDISIVGNNSIKLKGKQVTFVVNPAKDMPKISADAIVLLNGGANMGLTRVTDYRIVLDGPGEYEVGGAKISSTKTPKGTLYKFSIDGISVILGSAVEAKIEGFNVCEVAIVNTSIDFNEAFVTGLESKMTVLYGDKKVESAKALGAENASTISKVTIAKDKLPVEMEVVVLG